MKTIQQNNHPAYTKKWQYLWDFNKLLHLLAHHVSINEATLSHIHSGSLWFGMSLHQNQTHYMYISWKEILSSTPYSLSP
jgi:hypothetical protein